MKIYVASGLENVENARSLCTRLKIADHTITYEWMKHGAVWDKGERVVRDVATQEMSGVRHADVVVVLLPGGRGTHVELGAALALGKPVIIVSDPPLTICKETCAFHWLSGIIRVKSQDEMLAALEGLQLSKPRKRDEEEDV